MKSLLTALALLLLLPASASSAELDVANSVVSWKGSKVTGSFHEGNLTASSSKLNVDKGMLKGGSIVFDMNTLTVTDIEGGSAKKFLSHMRSTDFFDVDNHATTTIEFSVEGKEAAGKLTIKGISKPITFPIRKEGKKWVGVATFDRTKYGITYRSGNFFENLGDKMIKDEVEISFSLAIK